MTAHVLGTPPRCDCFSPGSTVIALWLGHEQAETTQIYLHANLAIKEQALERTRPAHAEPGRYHPPDAMLAFLKGL